MLAAKVFVLICRISICVRIVAMHISMLTIVVIIAIICMFVHNNSIFRLLLHHVQRGT